MTARLSLGLLLATCGLVAFVVLLRRASGALVVPLDFVPALGIGLLLSLGTWVLRRVALELASDQPKLLIWVTVITWALVVGATLSNTSPLAVLALWLPVIATEAYWRVVDQEA